MRPVAIALAFLFLATTIAEIKTYTHTVKQPFGGSQSPDGARIAAIARAKRECLEKAGTYLETLIVVKQRQLDKDQILALAAGVLKTRIISEKRPSRIPFTARVVWNFPDSISGINDHV